MEAITWPVALALVGCLVTVLTFLKSFLSKNDKPWQPDIDKDRRSTDGNRQKLETKIIIAEGHLDDLKRRLEELKKELRDNKNSNDRTNDKLEEKMEKLTQLVIDIISRIAN